MTPSRRRLSVLSAGLGLLLGAAPPGWAGPQDWRRFWLRQEWLGYEGTTASYGFRAGELALYGARHGVGVGTTAFQMRVAGWDVPRRDGNDASGHALFTFLPLNAYVTLHSWPGRKKIFFGRGKQSIGRLEAFASYCPWGRLSAFTRESRDILGDPQRLAVRGGVKAEVLDLGLRLDLGTLASFTAGRLQLDTADDGLFRPKRFEKLYAAFELYFDFGITEGREAGGGVRFLAQDAWYWLSRPFRRRGIVEGD